MEGRPSENPTDVAEPFTGAELSRIREHAGDDLLTFLLLRWTGLRGSDAVSITWSEVHFDRKEIERLTQKRKKRLIIPIHPELLFCLEAERQKHRVTDRV
jgi:integrase